jgi:chemotaxis signal transduction protein
VEDRTQEIIQAKTDGEVASSQLAHRQDEESQDDIMNFEEHIQVVSFLIAGAEYAIEILYIQEINKIPKITRLPNVPHFILGIMNLRGNVIPVVDLRRKFGHPPKEFDEESRAIVVEISQKQVALLVDEVHQSLRIRKSEVEFTTEMISGISADYILGVAKYKNRLIIMLKLGDVLLEEQSQNDRIFSQVAESGEEG